MKKISILLFTFVICPYTLLGQNNVITYTATDKLPEVTSPHGGVFDRGLHVHAFNVNIISHTFSNGTGIITFSGTVTRIEKSAFSICESLISIKIPNTITSIGEDAFYHCTSLATIVVPNSVTSIERGAFQYCTSLRHIIIPNSVISIGDYAFATCSSLTSIIIPNSVSRIGMRAFQYCTALTSISISNSVTSIEEGTFLECSSLTTITIPNSVTRIGWMAFSKCSKLNSFIVPNSVTTIQNDVFMGCLSLTSVIIPNSVTSIGEDVFEFCNKLTIYVQPESINRFKSMATLNGIKIVADGSKFIQEPAIPKQPPLLVFVQNSLKLLETNNNSTIDANESCKISFQITNKGKGSASGCEAKIKGIGTIQGLSFKSIKLPSIAVNETKTIEIPISANINTVNGSVTFTIEVTEPNGYGIDPMTLTVNTRAFDAPMLKIVDYAVSGNGTIQKKQPFDLQLLLQNTKYGKAEDVDVSISLPAGVTLWEGQEKIHYSIFDGGEKKSLNYQLAISGNYTGTTVPINISIEEKYGKFAENKTINLALNQQLASATSVVLQGEAQQVQREAIQIGALGSVVDRNIPVSSTVNKNTFAVIIANEKYMSVAAVPFALNDGMKFREYCVKTLGIPERNIRYIANATGNQLKAQVQWLQNITEVFDEPNIIFYYAGHGIPDESSKTAYLLPVDGIGTDVTTGYKLDNLYSALGQMPSVHTTIFLDACFSGSKREDGMLASARGIAIKAKSGVPQGNMVVFSAAQGDETAYPNKEEGHGMFTYYLLKKLQDTKGDVTLQDLGNYITKNVSQQSILINGKSQTPSVTAASTLGDTWQNWKLK